MDDLGYPHGLETSISLPSWKLLFAVTSQASETHGLKVGTRIQQFWDTQPDIADGFLQQLAVNQSLYNCRFNTEASDRPQTATCAKNEQMQSNWSIKLCPNRSVSAESLVHSCRGTWDTGTYARTLYGFRIPLGSMVAFMVHGGWASQKGTQVTSLFSSRTEKWTNLH